MRRSPKFLLLLFFLSSAMGAGLNSRTCPTHPALPAVRERHTPTAPPFSMPERRYPTSKQHISQRRLTEPLPKLGEDAHT